MEDKNTSKVSTTFNKPVHNSPSGLLANLFRKLTIKLGYGNKLKTLCRLAQIRDKQYRIQQGREDRLDEKLEYRLLSMATDSKVTFDKFHTLVSHLFNITHFKFSIAVKVKGSDDWIEVSQESINLLGPVEDDLTFVEDDEGVIENVKQQHDRNRFEQGS